MRFSAATPGIQVQVPKNVIFERGAIFAMSYVEKTLSQGELVLNAGKLHWVVFSGPVFVGLLSIGSLTWAVISQQTGLFALTVFLIVATVYLACAELIRTLTTELTVTSKRIVVKTGFISRRTEEQRLEKIDAIAVDQSILGRMLGYGTVTVKGSGQSVMPVKFVANPILFRVSAQSAIDDLSTANGNLSAR